MTQICRNMNGIYTGLWSVNQNHSVYASFDECQHTLKSRHSMKKMPGNKEMYTAKNHSIYEAIFTPSDSCQMYNLTASVHSLQSFTLDRVINRTESTECMNIHFVGDSLMFGNWIQLECEIERNQLSGFLRTTYDPHPLLRHDALCDFCDASTKSFCLKNMQDIRGRWGGHWGGAFPVSCTFDQQQSEAMASAHWSNLVPPNTIAVAFGGNAWYSTYFGYKNCSVATESYKLSIRNLLNESKALFEKGIKVIWIPTIPIPALEIEKDGSWPEKFTRYCRPNFDDRNEWTRDFFSGTHVIYLDLNATLVQRVLEDPKVKVDNQHYYIPSPNSVPAFIIQVMLNAIVIAFQNGS